MNMTTANEKVTSFDLYALSWHYDRNLLYCVMIFMKVCGVTDHAIN